MPTFPIIARRHTQLLLRLAATIFAMFGFSHPASAQMPFYTDDPSVTPRGTLHFEFFNEFDALQHGQYPDLHQNTDNFKVNFGLPFHLEFDVDFPYLAVFRAVGVQDSTGFGDADLGIKWHFREPAEGSHAPALSASLYIESPTGNVNQQLGSGVADYWLNLIAQERFSGKTRLNANLGFLFAGNTSTGVVGIETKRGHVYTGGLSLQHDFTSRLTLGAEVYGGIADEDVLARSQLQILAGGQYQIRNGLAVAFGVLGGTYVVSPKLGLQLGLAADFPDLLRVSRFHAN